MGPTLTLLSDLESQGLRLRLGPDGGLEVKGADPAALARVREHRLVLVRALAWRRAVSEEAREEAQLEFAGWDDALAGVYLLELGAAARELPGVDYFDRQLLAFWSTRAILADGKRATLPQDPRSAPGAGEDTPSTRSARGGLPGARRDPA